MPISSNAEYYKRRTEESRRAAANATDRSAVRVHMQMAAAYSKLVAEPPAEEQMAASIGPVVAL